MHLKENNSTITLAIKMKFAEAFILLTLLAAAAPSRNLQHDFQEILEVIPLDKMREIAQKYLNNDPEVQQVVGYLQSEEFEELISNIAANPSWIKFKEFMLKQGLDMEAFAQSVFEVIQGAGSKSKLQTRDIKGFANEIVSVIPVDALLAKISDKMQNSVDFQIFWEKISSEEAHQFVEEIRQIEEVRRLGQILRELGFDVNTILNVAYAILGWK
ncbi:hypothetical protein Trydic_g856 [Trypoxylus dichotomus]